MLYFESSPLVLNSMMVSSWPLESYPSNLATTSSITFPNFETTIPSVITELLPSRTLNSDTLFPDLFVVNSKQTLEAYENYLEQKLNKFGVNPHNEKLSTFYTGQPSKYYTPPVFDIDPIASANNMLYHKGQWIDVQALSDADRLTLALDLNYKELNHYNNLECIRAQNHLSTPTSKLHYPEPYIASASFIHTDIGFMRILHYQYWLWFFFIFLIVFFFLTFLTTVRWCNARVKPRRETRGVSRSKCGDLITACVPVSWAISIIVTESTDASDLYDGFGGAELTIGIRAYQWGWEYYYPKTLDLNYTQNTLHSSTVGNAFKYEALSGSTLNVNDLWRFYQSKSQDSALVPAHLILLQADKHGLAPFFSSETLGLNKLKESTAFKKIAVTKKANALTLSPSLNKNLSESHNVDAFYSSDELFQKARNYGLKRQQNLLSAKSANLLKETLLETNRNRTTELTLSSTSVLPNQLNLQLNAQDATRVAPSIQLMELNSGDLRTTSSYLNYENPTQAFFNSTSPISRTASAASTLTNSSPFNASSQTQPTPKAQLESIQSPIVASDNQSYLPAEQSPKQTLNANSFKGTEQVITKLNAQPASSSALHVAQVRTENYAPTLARQTTNKVLFDLPFSPAGSNNPLVETLSYDATNAVRSKNLAQTKATLTYNPLTLGENVALLQGKRDGAPQFLQSTYWRTLFEGISDTVRTQSLTTLAKQEEKAALPLPELFYDYDFRNMQAYELFEDLFWETSCSTYTHQDYQNIEKNFKHFLLVDQHQATREGLFLKVNTGGQETPVLEQLNLTPFHQSQVAATILDELGHYVGKSRPSTNKFKEVAEPWLKYKIQENDDLPSTPYALIEALKFETMNPSFKSSEAKYKHLTPFQPCVLSKDSLLARFLNKKTNQVILDAELYLSTPTVFDDLPLKAENVESSKTATLIDAPSALNLDDTYLVNNKAKQAPLTGVEYASEKATAFLSTESNSKTFNAFRAATEDASIAGPSIKASFNCWKGLTLTATEATNEEQKLSSPMALRRTARNSIVSFNALQKVFRARFEENRAHASLDQLSKLHVEQPFLTRFRPNYEQLLGKTKNSFFAVNFYNDTFALNPTLNTLIPAISTYQFFDFPFLLASKSDMARYIWMDWYAKWSLLEVQPSSVSRYSTLGVPYLKKPFDYNVESNDNLNEVETYLTRLSKARKNYLPIWAYTPYMFSRTQTWNKELFLPTPTASFLTHSYTRFLLDKAKGYHVRANFTNTTRTAFISSNSGLTTYLKSAWRPFSSFQGYYYSVSALSDFLSKRELLYRKYFEANNRMVALPIDLTLAPSNPLLSELKNNFNFLDQTNLNLESARTLSKDYIFPLQAFRGKLLKDPNLLHLEEAADQPVNLNFLKSLTDWARAVPQLWEDTSLYSTPLSKNPHRPMRKGITAMLRLHATGAIALPIDLRLQILASSRDVIHSWSVPSAGVKIDCVPGYTSHKILIFFMEGIYWGQCMEICGRYHHWMPIVVYFMRRDLFFLWCSHFAFGTATSSSTELNDKRNLNYIRCLNYDKASWINELR